jgi:hypothetical protein
VEAKICEELDAMGLLATPARPSPRPLRYEDLAELAYLGCVIKVPPRVPCAADSQDNFLVIGQHVLGPRQGLRNCTPRALENEP